eukprot:10714798-Alexandrium_andersonii.AAC.1
MSSLLAQRVGSSGGGASSSSICRPPGGSQKSGLRAMKPCHYKPLQTTSFLWPRVGKRLRQCFRSFQRCSQRQVCRFRQTSVRQLTTGGGRTEGPLVLGGSLFRSVRRIR